MVVLVAVPIFHLELHEAGLEDSQPLLRPLVRKRVADVEMGPDVRTFELVDVPGKLQRTDQKRSCA